MKIDIGCVVDLCEATAFAEIECVDSDKPVIGLFLPPGWDVHRIREVVSDTDSTSLGFYCPRHNPELKKAGVVVEEKDQAVVKLSEGESEPENLLRCSVQIVQGEKTGVENVVDRIIAQLKETDTTLEIAAELGLHPTLQTAEVEESRERLVAFFVDVVSAAGMTIRDRLDIDFHSASFVDDPPDPLCRVKTEAVIKPEKLADLGIYKRSAPIDVDLYEHYHPTLIGPTAKATYRPGDSKHAHESPAGPTSWELQTTDHTHEIDIVNGNRTGMPMLREVDPGKPASVDLKGHCHETKAGPTGSAQYREEDSKHAHNPGLGLTTWVDETPGHTHLMDKVGSERTGSPIMVDEAARRAKALNEALVLSVSDVEDRVIDHMECDTANYQTSVPSDVWEALTAAFADLTSIARERVKEIKGEQVGAVYRDGDGVVRIELEPGVVMAEAVEGLQRALACVQDAGSEGAKKIAVIRHDETSDTILVELEPGIELDTDLVDVMQRAWTRTHALETEQYCRRQREARERMQDPEPAHDTVGAGGAGMAERDETAKRKLLDDLRRQGVDVEALAGEVGLALHLVGGGVVRATDAAERDPDWEKESDPEHSDI